MALVVKKLSTNVGRHKTCGFDPWVRKIPWRRKWQPTPVFLPGKPYGQRAWQAVIDGVCKGIRHNLLTKQQEFFFLRDSPVPIVFLILVS